MAYTLDGRQLSLFAPADHGDEVPAAPCIFCGVTCKHINDGGTGWIVGAMMARGPEHFLYHGSPNCGGYAEDVRANPPHGSLWRCGCEADYVENVGAHCHACGKTRHDCAEYPSVVSCPNCACDLMAHEHSRVIRFRCAACAFQGEFDPRTSTVVPDGGGAP